MLRLMLIGSSHIAGGSGAGKAGVIAIVEIISANRVASILRDLFIFYSPFSFQWNIVYLVWI